MTDMEVSDCMDAKMWEEIDKRSKGNTVIYREIFGCIPDDLMTSTPKIKEVQESADLGKYDTLIGGVKGFCVEFPLEFLIEEDIGDMYYFETSSALLPTAIYL